MIFHPCRDVHQAAWNPCSYHHLAEVKDNVVFHQHSNDMRNHVPLWWSQCCSVYGEEEGSKNRSLRNTSDQLMYFGYLPSPGHPERPTCEIGFIPAKWNTLWCPVMRHYLSTRSYPHSPPSSHFFLSHTCAYSHYQHLTSHWYISHSI